VFFGEATYSAVLHSHRSASGEAWEVSELRWACWHLTPSTGKPSSACRSAKRDQGFSSEGLSFETL